MGLDNAACRWAAPARYPWVLVTIPSSVKGDRKTYHWVVATRRSSRPRGPPTLPPPFIAAVGPDDPSASVRRWRIWVLLTHERLGFGYVDAELFFVNPEVFDVLQHCDYFVSAEFRAKSWHRALESRHAGVLKAGAALAHYLVKETVRVVPRMSFSVEGRGAVGGNIPSSEGMCQSGWPPPSAPWHTAQLAANMPLPVVWLVSATIRIPISSVCSPPSVHAISRARTKINAVRVAGRAAG